MNCEKVVFGLLFADFPVSALESRQFFSPFTCDTKVVSPQSLRPRYQGIGDIFVWHLAYVFSRHDFHIGVSVLFGIDRFLQ
jgi:hypothetical protein